MADILGLLKEAYGKMNEAYRWLDSTPKGYPEHLPKLEASLSKK
ncbi:hypothetical protein P4S63_08790 [Pseudoalteromonas sp. B193]